MKTRRFLSLLLTLVMVIGMLPTAVFAADCAHTTVTDGICTECQMYGYCGAPETEGGAVTDKVIWILTQNNEDAENPTYTLTLTGTGATAEYEQVTIEAGVKYTASSPWAQSQYADSITKAVVNDGITALGNMAFRYLPNLTDVSLPTSLTQIGKYTFTDCSSLSEIIIPDSVTTMGISTFRNCSSLSYVKLPSSLTAIPNYMIEYCTSLQSITIPASVTNIHNTAFSGAENLSTIYYLATSKPTLDGGTDLIVPQNVTIYVPCTYEDTTFGDETVTFFHDLAEDTGICTVCHGYCGAPESEGGAVTDKVIWSFKDGTLTLAGTGATADYVQVQRPGFSSIASSPWVQTQFTDSIKKAVVNEGITVLGDMTFRYLSNLTEVSLPDSLTAIGKRAFSNCGSLTQIEIPDGVHTIGQATFHYAVNLSSVKLPSALTTIPSHMFNSCSSLQSITIPASVTSIENSCFSSVNSVFTIYYLGATEPTMDSFVYLCNASDCTLYVPCTYSGTTFGGKTVTNGHFEAKTGTSNLTYSDSGNSIVQYCNYCQTTDTATLVIEENKAYDGENKVSVVYTDGWIGGKLDVTEAIQPGTYTASITYKGAIASTEEFTVTKAPLTVTAKDQTITYGGSIETGVDQVSGSLATGDQFSEITLTPSDTDYPGGTITPSDAKIVNAAGNVVTDNYDITYANGNLTINKAASSVTEAPAAASGLTYTGKPQTLVSGGTAEGGTLVYSTTQDGTYAETIPTGTDAGSYEVWYKIQGDANHSDSTPVMLTGEIAPADASGAVVTVTGSYSYTSKEIIPAANEVTVTLDGKPLTYDKDYTFEASNNIEVGTNTAIITVTFKGNYTGTATGRFTIIPCPHNAFEDKKCTQCGGICGVVKDHAYTNGICVNGCYQPAIDENQDGTYEISNPRSTTSPVWTARKLKTATSTQNWSSSSLRCMPSKTSWMQKVLPKVNWNRQQPASTKWRQSFRG